MCSYHTMDDPAGFGPTVSEDNNKETASTANIRYIDAPTKRYAIMQHHSTPVIVLSVGCGSPLLASLALRLAWGFCQITSGR